jgi:bifunctional non-homologous end joining protein LigD
VPRGRSGATRLPEWGWFGYDLSVPGGVELSRLEKMYWPDDGLTKGDLIRYVEAVAPQFVHHLRNRPLTVIRFPDGIAGGSFYQKQTPDYAPPWVRTITLPADSGRGKRKEVRYALCNDRRTLVWLANQGSIEFHPWISRVDRLWRPEYLIMDVDPPPGRFDLAVRTALVTREVLARHGLESCAKTSGAKGVHVYVPLQRRHGFDEASRAAVALAAEAAAVEPDLITVEFLKKERGDRVFLDATRIGPGKHTVCAYSPRARPGGTVSFPVPWKDLEHVAPQDFTIANVPERIGGGDPWQELMPPAQRLPAELTREPAES